MTEPIKNALENNTIPDPGTRVVTQIDPKLNTEGFNVEPSTLAGRKDGPGRFVGVIAHNPDLWWIQHDDGQTMCYIKTEVGDSDALPVDHAEMSRLKQAMHEIKKGDYTRDLLVLDYPAPAEDDKTQVVIIPAPMIVMQGMNNIKEYFSVLISLWGNQYEHHAPFIIRIQDISTFGKENEFTTGLYVGIDQDDGSFDLYLNYQQIEERKSFPLQILLWTVMHGFAHTIQKKEPQIMSVIDYPNWSNFKAYIMKAFGASEEKFDHIFNELNPSVIHANMFACEMTGIDHRGGLFDVTLESLKRLSDKEWEPNKS